MNPDKLYFSLDSLNDWTSRIIEISKNSRFSRLSALLEESDFASYWSFYKELIPFLKNFTAGMENEEIAKLVTEFEGNVVLIEDLMQPTFSLFDVVRFFFISFSAGRSSDDFKAGLNKLSNNISNLLYQMRINRSA